jgi:hypothetical protein
MGPKLLKGTHLYYVAAAKEEHTPTTLKPWKGRKSKGHSYTTLSMQRRVLKDTT